MTNEEATVRRWTTLVGTIAAGLITTFIIWMGATVVSQGQQIAAMEAKLEAVQTQLSRIERKLE